MDGIAVQMLSPNDPDSAHASAAMDVVITPRSGAAAASALRNSRRYALGIILLLLVVVLWVGSSTLIQSIFVEHDFRQPLFLTYYSTSLFSVYVPMWWLNRWVRRQRWWCLGERSRMRREAVLLYDGSAEVSHSAAPSPGGMLAPSPRVEGGSNNGHTRNGSGRLSPHSLRPTPVLVQSALDEHAPLTLNLPHGSNRVSGDAAADDVPGEPAVEKLSVWATARLSLHLCPLWFLMNYLFNLSLNLTSLASTTILSTTSSLFVLLFGLCMRPRAEVRLPQALGVAFTILGATLISWRDMAGGEGADEGTQHSLVGDVVAALSALFYALYSLQLRIRIPDESAVDMTLLFGFIGVVNTLFAWPLFPLLDAWGVETWVGMPSGAVLGFLTLNGLAGTVLSDYLWARSVLLTSPLIASLGLALTVPLALLVDVLLNGTRLTVLYVLGGGAVLVGFGLVNVAHKKKLEAQVEEAIAGAEEAHGGGGGEHAEAGAENEREALSSSSNNNDSPHRARAPSDPAYHASTPRGTDVFGPAGAASSSVMSSSSSSAGLQAALASAPASASASPRVLELVSHTG